MKVIQDLDLLIMLELIKDLTRKWTINELSRTITKHYKPTYVAVQRLINQEYIQKNKNDLIEPLFNNTLLLELAEKKRFDDLNNKDLKIIKRKFDLIENSFFSVVLFGSSVYSKGKDIDLLIILPDSSHINEFEQIVKKSLGSFYSKVDLNIITEISCYEMLNKPNELNVLNEIFKNHLVIVGIENFYRIIKRWKCA